MKRFLFVCVIFAAVAILPHPGFAALSYVNVFVEASGTGGGGYSVYDESGSGSYSASASGSISSSYEGPPPGWLSASAGGSAGLTPSSSLQLRSIAFTQGGENNRFGPLAPGARAEAGANFRDGLTIGPPTIGMMPAYLTFHLSASGSIEDGDYSSGQARLFFSSGGALEYITDTDGGGMSLSVDAPVISGRVDYTYSLVCIASAKNGIGKANYSETAIISSILLPDGFTPESQGYTLTFDSGMISPNLNLVPLPGTLGLLFSGLLAAAAGRRRLKN